MSFGFYKMRKNGFSYPFDRLQIVSWALFVVTVFSFYFTYLPLSHYSYLPISCVPYTITLFMVVYYTFKVCISNPGDPNLLGTSKALSKDKKRCTVCCSSVNNSSKHCTYCEKCVFGFDHHCRILNNCIGNSNYNDFFKLIVWVELLLCVQLIVAGFVLADFRGLKMDLGFLVFVLMESIVHTGLLVANGFFIGFHCWISWNGSSTIEFILNNRKRSKSVVPALDKSSIGEQYVINSPQSKDHSFMSISKDASTNM